MTDLTPDNQPTQSFDEKLEQAVWMAISQSVAASINTEGDTTKNSEEHFTEALTAIKAAIREARPERRQFDNPYEAFSYGLALDEWSKNMNLEVTNEKEEEHRPHCCRNHQR